MNLTELGAKYRTRKLLHGYLPVYEKYFEPIREKVTKVLEIGILKGASLKMWRDYFPNATIYGFDESYYDFKEDRVETFAGRAENREELRAFINKYGADFDIIIDDCGHWNDQQQITFGYMFRYLKPNGIYVIEDLTSGVYRKHYLTKYTYAGEELDTDIRRIMSNHPIYMIAVGKYGVLPDSSNTTLNMIKKFIKDKEIFSYYLHQDEINVLENNIQSVKLHEECLDIPEDTGQDRQSGVICFFWNKA